MTEHYFHPAMTTIPSGVAAAIDRALGATPISQHHDAGQIPAWYGAEHPYTAWMRVWRAMAALRELTPDERAFYQAGCVGWASR